MKALELPMASLDLPAVEQLVACSPRYYNPKDGRFISKDPLSFQGGDVNVYRYGGNNPVSGRDPTGLVFETIGPVLSMFARSLHYIAHLNRGFEGSWGLGRAITKSISLSSNDAFELADTSQSLGELQLLDIMSEVRRGNAISNRLNQVWSDAVDATFEMNEAILFDVVMSGFFATACFAAGTPVVTGIDSDGGYRTKAIEEIREGEYVLARDEWNRTPDSRLQRVEKVYTRETDHMLLLTVENGRGHKSIIQTTDGHLIWAIGRGWTKAADLCPGDCLIEASGTETVVVRAKERTELTTPVQVYTFRVAKDHTYFIADSLGRARLSVWVHNVCAGVKTMEDALQNSKGVSGQAKSARRYPVPGRQYRETDAVWDVAEGKAAGDAKWVKNWATSIYSPISSIASKPFAQAVRQGLIKQTADYPTHFKFVEIWSNSLDFIAYYTGQFSAAGLDMSKIKFVYHPV